MDIGFFILTVLLFFILSQLAFVFDVHGQLIDSYLKFKNRKKKYLYCNCYIVEFPSGEIMYLDNVRTLNYLLNIGIVSYVSEFRCFCYRDYDKKYVKKFIKIHKRESKNYD